MRPVLSSSNLEKLEEIKREIKCLLIATSNEDVTLDRLSSIYKDEIGDCIPFKDFNYTNLKDFLLSIPDAVRLRFDKKSNSTYVYHVESSKTRHITSLIARQKTKKKSSRSGCKGKLNSISIDPIILTRVMLKLSSSSAISGYFKKADVLSEIQSILGAPSLYTVRDLTIQLNKLNHILVHNDEYVHLKNEKRLCQEHLLQDFIKQDTKDRLKKLAKKYPEGIWCGQLPGVYRKEYGIDLEYRDLGFTSISDFVAVLSGIFKFIKPPNTSEFKVISTEMSIDCLKNLVVTDPVDNVTTDINGTFHAIPINSSSKLSKNLIPKEFMNFEDSVEQINVEIIMDNSDVIVSEICNPSLFWIILQKNKRKLIKLMDYLQEFYVHQDLDIYKIPPILLKPGLHVACIYSNRWHRGIIKSVESNSLMIVFYDYGTTKLYEAKKLYFLHKKFSSVPAQAIPCSLYNVKSIESDVWTKVAIEKFVDRAIEKYFVVSIFSRNQENNSLTVDLIDNANAVNLYITQWMVSNKLAMRGNHGIEKNNSIIMHNKECSSKHQSKSIKQNLQNLNRIILNEEAVQNSDYVRPAKQLEALKNYKIRYKLQGTSSADSSTKIKIENCQGVHVKEKKENCVESKKQKITKNNISKTLKELQKLIASTKL